MTAETWEVPLNAWLLSLSDNKLPPKKLKTTFIISVFEDLSWNGNLGAGKSRGN